MPSDSLRVLIADDEEPARRVLKEYLGAHPQYQICAEARSGLEAVQMAGSERPDVILLDVQMPKLDGFEVLGLLAKEIAVVFTTAFDEYAVRAFEVHAVDYLLKPFSAERFAQALVRVAARMRATESVSPNDLAQAARRPGTYLERLVIRNGQEILIVPAPQVQFFRGQDDYVEVFHDAGSTLTPQTLQSLENSLDPSQFVRVHRSYLINLTHLVRIDSAGSTKIALLRNGQHVPISRSGETRLRAALGR